MLYSVLQSDGNSFGGDVFMDSFNLAYRGEDSDNITLYKKSKYFRIVQGDWRKWIPKEMQPSTTRNS